MDKVTLRFERVDALQILDGLRARRDSWERTLQYLESGYVSGDDGVEECSDEGEANSIVQHYTDLVNQIEMQLSNQSAI